MGKSSGKQLEFVLESRQLLLVFFVIVALCGVFFSLGYIVGRNTLYEPIPAAQATAEATAAGDKPSPMPPASYLNRPQTETAPSAEPATPGTDLSFYQSAEKPAEPATAPSGPSESPASQPSSSRQEGLPPLPLPPGILIQVSALTRREDAETLVQLLKEKNLPVTVTSGAGDSLFHVVVGPYQDEKEAQRVRALLELDGFRPILKR